MPKPKKCRVCKSEFSPFNSTQRVCSPGCAIKHVEQQKEREFDKETRRLKKKLKTLSDWLREAQAECNRYIRARDEGELCISCQKPPKKKNAGHYRSRGACPELRFHPMNIHLQCEHCNSFKSGNAIDYRINLINKIGLKNVEWLEGPHQAQHLTIDDATEIKAYYKEQLKLINKTDTE